MAPKCNIEPDKIRANGPLLLVDGKGGELDETAALCARANKVVKALVFSISHLSLRAKCLRQQLTLTKCIPIYPQKRTRINALQKIVGHKIRGDFNKTKCRENTSIFLSNDTNHPLRAKL